MTWDLVSSRVDLHGYLNVSPTLLSTSQLTHSPARSSNPTLRTGSTRPTPTA